MPLIYDIDLDETELSYVHRQLDIIGDFDRRELPSIMEATAKELGEEFRFYPPERAGSRYVRTFKYKDSVSTDTKRIPNGMQAIARSSGVRYNAVLKDQRNQASIHRGRWPTTTDDAETVFPKLVRRLEKAKDGFKL